MDQRLSLITLGVADLGRARTFYEGLGWSPRQDDLDDVVFFQAAGVVLALWSRASLAEDSCVTDTGGWGGVTLAHNVESPAAVAAVLAQAQRAGGTVVRAGAETVWGGFSGVFLDPDGYPWEVAHNPSWTITSEGATLLS